MKKIIFLLALIVAALSSLHAQTVRGDVNGDGVVTMADVNEVMNIYLTQKETPSSIGTHEYVDLGLPSGTLWAKTNVGAEKETDYGLYFAWGETVGYTSDTTDGRLFNWESLRYCGGKTEKGPFTKYVATSTYGTVDNKTVLEPQDDAATVNWGSDWQMPTHAQLIELVNSSYTTVTWAIRDGVNGTLVTSNANGNTLFLPAAGIREDDGLYSLGKTGIYISRELDDLGSKVVAKLEIRSGGVITKNGCGRCIGSSVRPVRSSTK